MTIAPLLPATGTNVLSLLAETDPVRIQLADLIERVGVMGAHLVVDRELHAPESPFIFIVVKDEIRYGPLTVDQSDLLGAVKFIEGWLETIRLKQLH